MTVQTARELTRAVLRLQRRRLMKARIHPRVFQARPQAAFARRVAKRLACRQPERVIKQFAGALKHWLEWNIR